MQQLMVLCAIALMLVATPVLAQTPDMSAQTAAEVMSASAPPASSASTTPSAPIVTDAAYRLGPGDRVRVTVFGETELTGEYDVAANGGLAFPLVGEVPAQGLTPQQLSDAIAQRLSAGYLREPRVASAVIGYRPFYILGEVTRPGTYPYAADLDVMSAVAVAGGFTYRASRGHVYIRRLGESEERRYSLRDRVVVRPGDTVRVGERWF
jgi:protein involved in polysaccharide export with SLBB domain